MAEWFQTTNNKWENFCLRCWIDEVTERVIQEKDSLKCWNIIHWQCQRFMSACFETVNIIMKSRMRESRTYSYPRRIQGRTGQPHARHIPHPWDLESVNGSPYFGRWKIHRFLCDRQTSCPWSGRHSEPNEGQGQVVYHPRPPSGNRWKSDIWKGADQPAPVFSAKQKEAGLSAER